MSVDKKELSVEELIEIAKTPTKQKIKTYMSSDAHNFIVDFQLEAGPIPVSAKLLYELYNIWKRKGKTQHKQKFFRDFRKYINTRGTDGKMIFYKLNVHPLDLEEAVKDRIYG